MYNIYKCSVSKLVEYERNNIFCKYTLSRNKQIIGIKIFDNKITDINSGLSYPILKRRKYYDFLIKKQFDFHLLILNIHNF